MKSSNAEAYDEFGGSVALSRDGRTMVVSAHSEDGGSKGVGGNQADNGSSGRAPRTSSPPTDVGGGGGGRGCEDVRWRGQKARGTSCLGGMMGDGG